MKLLTSMLFCCALLVGCAEKGKESSQEQIASSIYRSGTQPTLTVFTMINNRSGQGAHTALLVNASQTVLFDPAGSFNHPDVPASGDVLYGMSPSWVQIYKSAHARSLFHVVSQEIAVTPAQAERALQLVQAKGSVPSAMCASATTGILREIPGFEDIRSGFYPTALMKQMQVRPGVSTTRYYENDDGNVVDGVQGQLQ
ncbi:hypothetical protein C1J03_04210 [Sulfitobacter sp. SK012]|uniref:hypothetical protein n=1 Tax=Sulfitobacter sp. SK012 TaxID=1389005 RepID=UPI000E09FC6F|nr:hypothetical protein [Sulfitobacter sp. SK012]AXI45310.1 hypothetical protein C1J03_04210 [Sulfitobacter sp. SK012]